MKKTSNYTLHNPSPVPGLAQAVRESGAGNCILGTQEKNTKLPLRIFNYIFQINGCQFFLREEPPGPPKHRDKPHIHIPFVSLFIQIR